MTDKFALVCSQCKTEGWGGFHLSRKKEWLCDRCEEPRPDPLRRPPRKVVTAS